MYFKPAVTDSLLISCMTMGTVERVASSKAKYRVTISADIHTAIMAPRAMKKNVKNMGVRFSCSM